MKDKDKYKEETGKGFRLPEEPEYKGFSVPEGYFDELNRNIIANVPNLAGDSGIRKMNLKPLYAVAASFAALCVFAGTVVLIKPEIINNIFPVKSNDITAVQDTQASQQTIATDTAFTIDQANAEPAQESIQSEETQLSLIDDDKTTKSKPKSSSGVIRSERGAETHDDTYSPVPANQIHSPQTTAGATSGRDKKNTDEAFKKPPPFSLGEDRCSEKAIELSVPQRSGVYYRWYNGSSSPSIIVDKSADVYLLLSFYPDFRTFTSDTVRISIIPKPEINIPGSQNLCSNEPLVVYAIENQEHSNLYTYSWTNSNSISNFMKLSGLKPGVHLFSVEVKGCKPYNKSFQVIVNDCNIKIPNVFTPNADGYNDIFEIEGLEAYPGSTLQVFDRNGRLVFQSNDYQNNWDANGVESGSYFYILILNDSNKTERKGSVTIYR